MELCYILHYLVGISSIIKQLQLKNLDLLFMASFLINLIKILKFKTLTSISSNLIKLNFN